MNRLFSGMMVVWMSGCNSPDEPKVQQPLPAPTTPVASPVTTPEGPPLPPVQPGTYVNHIGNPAHGHWGPDGQWVWKQPESPEANETWKFLAAAGAGAAGGAALSMLMSKRHFETRNPDGQWRPENNSHTEMNYRDKRGNPISREEFERRKAQSERDRARYWEQKKAQQNQLEQRRQQGYQQPKAQPQAQPRPQPKFKRWKRKRRR